MKITKFVHSCLLVEDSGSTALFDPGNFSYDAGFFTPLSFNALDDIIITHAHSDHCHIPLLHELVKAFPNVVITTIPDVASKLTALGFSNVKTEGNANIKMFAVNHEPVEPVGKTPANTGFHYLDKITNPGDGYGFTQSKDILILPVTAPWGCLVKAAELILQLKPKYVIPVHDWHWNVTARQQAYITLQDFCDQNGITFLSPVDGKAMQIEA
ncbi:MAG: MBL fold metallo-hydrolase [Candidatus Woesebacteria bacterium]|jgi:L-ascorbate metabolism protein UlaG (beta-lactamase superfamily)